LQLLTLFRRDSSVACVLQNLSLNDTPTFQHVPDACIALKLTCRIDMNALYDEFSYALQHTVKWEKTVGEKWQQFFCMCKERVQCISPCFIRAVNERIFSLTNSKWRCNRNRTSVSLVKSELQVFVNYDVDCRDFYSLLQTQSR